MQDSHREEVTPLTKRLARGPVNVVFGTLKTTEYGQEAKDLFVLTNGHTTRRIDETSGDSIWSWAAPEQMYADGSFFTPL